LVWGTLRIPARSDYALRAVRAIARVWPERITAEEIRDIEKLPLAFLENILAELRQAGLLTARRGHGGGYALTRPPEAIDLAQVLHAVNCPLVTGEDHFIESPLASMWSDLDDLVLVQLTRRSLADLVAAGGSQGAEKRS
jgi:Rrf2 family protein